jgi:hypothetical protein
MGARTNAIDLSKRLDRSKRPQVEAPVVLVDDTKRASLYWMRKPWT